MNQMNQMKVILTWDIWHRKLSITIHFPIQVKVKIEEKMSNLMSKYYGSDHEIIFDIDLLQTEVRKFWNVDF